MNALTLMVALVAFVLSVIALASTVDSIRRISACEERQVGMPLHFTPRYSATATTNVAPPRQMTEVARVVPRQATAREHVGTDFQKRLRSAGRKTLTRKKKG